jgi:hypothetical protein
MNELERNEKLLEEISKKLNVLISLSIRQLPSDQNLEKKPNQGVGEIARYLGSLGLNSKDIAQITGAPLSSVRTLLTPSQKPKR